MVTAYIGIGSNLGNRRKNIEKAINCLKNREVIKVLKTSSLYETGPVGGPPQGNFLNGAICISTELSPLELLNCLNDIEDQLGRVRLEKNGPRTIDLDILLYGDIKMHSAKLVIPHPRMHERDFVLRPLREIAPEFVEQI